MTSNEPPGRSAGTTIRRVIDVAFGVAAIVIGLATYVTADQWPLAAAGTFWTAGGVWLLVAAFAVPLDTCRGETIVFETDAAGAPVLLRCEGCSWRRRLAGMDELVEAVNQHPSARVR